MRVAALFSGGKDSNLALDIALQSGWDVTHLVTVRPANPESMMFHVPNLDLVPLMAEARGIPLVTVETAGEPEHELDELETALRELSIDGVIAGAVASEYQRTRIERVAHRVGIKSFTPIWHKRPRDVVRSLVAGGYDVRFASVAAEGFTEEWLGRRLDDDAVAELDALHARYAVNVAGEGGEYESLVLDGPFCRARIVVDSAHGTWSRDHGTWRVDAAHLEPKG